MNSIKIKPSKLRGHIIIPPSKSLSHRAIICAALCNKGESIISNLILSEDIKATIDGVKALGANTELIKEENNIYKLKINKSQYDINLKKDKKISINCRESGSTLRFLIPLGLALKEECEFTGYGKLVERPLEVYYKIFDEQGIVYENNNGKLPLKVKGKLKSGQFKVEGNISSQFISGLFFTLPLLSDNSQIKIINNLESKGYIDLTLDILKKFNIHIENNNYEEFLVKGNSEYKALNYKVEGDYSQGAFFLVAKELGNKVLCEGLEENSLQGDKEILNIISKFQDLKENEIVIDASQIPDLVPILTVLACLQENKITKIIKAERLRIKESDRLKAIATELNKLGGEVNELPDGLVIKGKNTLKGGAKVSSWNDHRIAMALAIAATRCEEEVILEGFEAVNKSYPDFWNDYKSLGGEIYELSLGK